MAKSTQSSLELGHSAPTNSTPRDLRTPSLKLLGEVAARSKLGQEWAAWLTVLALEEASQATIHVAWNGRGTFELLDAWFGTQHAELARLVVSLADEFGLADLQSAAKLTPRGAPVGGQYLDNPLRGALSLAKQVQLKPLLDVCCALAFAAKGHLDVAVSENRIRRICGAVHNHTTPEWSAFLALCPPPKNLHSLKEVLAWGTSLATSTNQHARRATEQQFLSDLAKLCTSIADLESKRSDGPTSQTAVRQSVTLGAPAEREAALPETAVRSFEQVIDPSKESETEADEPDLVQFVQGAATPADEPAQPDGVQTTDCIRTGFRTAAENQHLRYHWDTLTPEETSALVTAVELDLARGDPAARTAALLVGVALCLGWRPHEAGLMPVSDGQRPGLDLRRGIFVKQIPRPPHSWRPKPDTQCALLASADCVSLPLPKSLVSHLKRRALANPPRDTLYQALGLDIQAGQAMVAEWLAIQRQAHHRFTARRIARVLDVVTFGITRRAVLTYWVAGTAEDPPQSGAYYVAAPACDIQQAYTQAIKSIWREAGEDAALIAPGAPDAFVGSRLVPPDHAIREFVSQLAEQVSPPAGHDLESIRRYHNAYTTYVVTLLMFATGHRPVDDPFDAHLVVDENRGYVLIDDKNVGHERSLRLVPLAEMAKAQLRAYRRHLLGLLALLDANVGTAHRALAAQLAKPDERILPLFFYVDSQGDWQSVTPSMLRYHQPADWAYPDRVHRHLLATWLYQDQQDEEASAQLLGHIDVGTAALSLVSPHSPRSLFEPVLPSIQQFLVHHGWTVLDGLTADPLPVAAPGEQAIPKRWFGAEARRQRRIALEEADRAEIDGLITAVLDGRPPADLNQADVRSLIERVTARTPLRSSRRGLFRMSALRDSLADHKKTHRLRIKLPRLIRVLARAESLFQESSLSDARRASSLRKAFLAHLASIQTPLSPTAHPQTRAAYALFALIASARVLDHDLLQRVLDGNPYWLIADARYGAFVELQLNRKNIRRYPVDAMTAAMLSSPCFAAERKSAILREFERLIARLTGGDLRRNSDALRRTVACFRDEAALDLPGYLFGYVTGESGSVSLPRHAWLRMLTDQTPVDAKLPILVAAETAIDDDSATLTDKSREPEIADPPPAVEEGHTRRQAVEFVEWVNDQIRALWNRGVDEKGQTRKLNRASLPAMVAAVEPRLAELKAAHALPPIAYLLGQWLLRLCKSGSRRGPVVASTIVTYWGSLAGSLAERAHDIALPNLLGDALEEIYGTVLTDTEYETPHLILGRLQLFHAFLMQNFGAAEVDWSAVIPEGFPAKEIPVDAGFISEAEYLRALALLEEDPHTPDLRQRLIHCTCLILVWRFGLRISEATGIRRKDILGRVPELQVRVANDEFRKVKTDAGLRTVPLLEPLTDREVRVLNLWLDHIDHCHVDDRLAGLFAERDKARTLVSQWRVASRVTDALAAATGDPAVRIHHARHTFASRGMLSLCSAQSSSHASAAFASDIRTRLLGSETVSRRGLWALAAIIGHAFPATTTRYYGHTHDLALAVLAHAPVEVDARALENALGVRNTALRTADCGASNAQFLGYLTDSGRIEKAENAVRERELVQLHEPRFTVQREAPKSVGAVLRILQRAGLDCRIENLSNRLLFAPDFIARTVEAAAAVRERAAYEIPWSEGSTEILSIKEWRRLFQASANVERLEFANPDLLGKVAASWIEGYSPSAKLLLLRNQEELETLVKFLRQCGVAPDQQMLRADPARTGDEWCAEIIAAAKKLGIHAVASERLPLFSAAGKLRANQVRRVGFSIFEANAGFIRSAKALHRLLFAVAITCNI